MSEKAVGAARAQSDAYSMQTNGVFPRWNSHEKDTRQIKTSETFVQTSASILARQKTTLIADILQQQDSDEDTVIIQDGMIEALGRDRAQQKSLTSSVKEQL